MDLGDECIGFELFDLSSGDLGQLNGTTFVELESRGLIEEMVPLMRQVRLTGRGWIEGLEQQGRVYDQGMRDDLILLRMALKGHVKGRQGDELVAPKAIGVETGLTGEWISNVIESGLLERFFPSDHVDARWDPDARWQLIRIPSTFGMERL